MKTTAILLASVLSLANAQLPGPAPGDPLPQVSTPVDPLPSATGKPHHKSGEGYPTVGGAPSTYPAGQPTGYPGGGYPTTPAAASYTVTAPGVPTPTTLRPHKHTTYPVAPSPSLCPHVYHGGQWVPAAHANEPRWVVFDSPASADGSGPAWSNSMPGGPVTPYPVGGGHGHSHGSSTMPGPGAPIPVTSYPVTPVGPSGPAGTGNMHHHHHHKTSWGPCPTSTYPAVGGGGGGYGTGSASIQPAPPTGSPIATGAAANVRAGIGSMAGVAAAVVMLL